MDCGDGEATRTRSCISACSNVDVNDQNHSLVETRACNNDCVSECKWIIFFKIIVPQKQLIKLAYNINSITSMLKNFQKFSGMVW